MLFKCAYGTLTEGLGIAVPDVGAALAALTLDGMDEIEPPIESPHPSASARVDQHVQQTWEEALEAAASEQEQVLRTLFEAGERSM